MPQTPQKLAVVGILAPQLIQNFVPASVGGGGAATVAMAGARSSGGAPSL